MKNGLGSREVEATLSDERITQLRRMLLASVRRACPAWLASQAEDIVQTALIRLLDFHRTSGGDPHLNPSYLSRVGYNAVVDEVRRRFKQKEIPLGERLQLESAPAKAAHPEQHAAAAEIHQGMRDCLRNMIPPRRRSVACHLLGYSVPETARFLGWTRKKVEHLTRRGLEDLRACLSDKGLVP